ncbi:2TM domain-containing protein [Cellulophaga baltica]|uniref:2TM domain-containing protein n=1 Tax=Cellulophaga TaxID=104264 RepID=UPI001C0658EA|nr:MULTISPECIES: 2TM domain-containing protein [Cellulophaga]MBU2997348.1 2TM domain-containing protein [Cellulophaga baltica]MDO6768746.1 2TM domain-containing protein [Cellulophaga sp. 1_MG-2023]
MKYLGKIIGIGFLIGVAVAFIDIGFQFLAGNTISAQTILSYKISYYFLYSILLTLVNYSFFNYLDNKVVWKNYGKFRLLIGALGSVVLTMFTVFLIRLTVEMYFNGEDFNTFINGEKPIFYGISLIITIFFSVLSHAIYFYKISQNIKVKEQKIIAGTASAKFDALKNQLDPHFLFNSLNVLTSLIEEDPYQAQKFTTSLSKVYRYVLEQKNKDLVLVDEELSFAKTYVRLLKMRFEDSIVFEIPEKSSIPDAKIIPLSLQLLLENAVKHNIVTTAKPLRIKVFEENGLLMVTNNLQEKQVVKKSSGVGLKNIQERYAILSDKTVSIEKKEKEFVVALPILTKKISFDTAQNDYVESKSYEKAKEKVEKIKSFYKHLIAYCIVIPFLIVQNSKTSNFLWVFFPVIGWGFGLAAHGMKAFGYNPLFGKNWEERKMKEYLEDENF